VDLYSALHIIASNVPPLPVSRRWSPTLQPGIQQTLRDHGYGLVYHAICLFTSPRLHRVLIPA